MSDGDGGGAPQPTVPPAPPVVPDASSIVIDADASERHFPGNGFDLVQTRRPDGGAEWTLFVKRPDTEKPEPMPAPTEQS
jgi:hypothetical protein